jgi:hypothetical protein
MTLLLLACVPCAIATAAAPTFTDRVRAIETATAVELARLEVELAATTDQARVLELQRCAAWVKLSARLALHETQLAAAPADPEVARTLETLAADLRAQMAGQAERLPADYAFEPLATLEAEAPSCAE